MAMITLHDIVDSLGLAQTWTGDHRVFIRDVKKIPKPTHHATQWMWPPGDPQIQTVRVALWHKWGDGNPLPADTRGVLAGLPCMPRSPHVHVHVASAAAPAAAPASAPPAYREERYPFGSTPTRTRT